MQDFITFRERRNKLIEHVKQSHNITEGVIVLSASYEPEYTVFRQDSTFYYFTGINEPACVCLLWLTGETHLYLPVYPDFRHKWVVAGITLDSNPNAYQLDGIYQAGVRQSGIAVSPVHEASAYEYVIRDLREAYTSGMPICACVPHNSYAYVQQQQFVRAIERGIDWAPQYYDISPSVSALRRKKSRDEVAKIYNAASITAMAHEAAACALEPGVPEYYVQAAAEYILTECNARPAFPSVVASGENSTVLHYAVNADDIGQQDTVVVDIGAYHDHYAADVTRTYPANGQFSKEQARVYEAVRDTQEYVANLLAPGYYIYNAEQPDISLYHRAQERLKQHGFHEYFIHNIGHFLGLDVHDVGNIREPLEEGDVITIEPGVYDAENHIGVRIEDNYWLVNGGSVCLTEGLPTEQAEVERLAQRGFSQMSEEVEQSEQSDG